MSASKLLDPVRARLLTVVCGHHAIDRNLMQYAHCRHCVRSASQLCSRCRERKKRKRRHQPPEQECVHALHTLSDVLFAVPATKPLECPGDYDDVCLLCGRWCSERAACSNRYHLLSGGFVREAAATVPTVCFVQPGREPSTGSTLERVAVCDPCWHRAAEEEEEDADPDHSRELCVLGARFRMDEHHRAND
jgi:hypothetical protein